MSLTSCLLRSYDHFQTNKRSVSQHSFQRVLKKTSLGEPFSIKREGECFTSFNRLSGSTLLCTGFGQAKLHDISNDNDQPIGFKVGNLPGGSNMNLLIHNGSAISFQSNRSICFGFDFDRMIDFKVFNHPNLKTIQSHDFHFAHRFSALNGNRVLYVSHTRTLEEIDIDEVRRSLQDSKPVTLAEEIFDFSVMRRQCKSRIYTMGVKGNIRLLDSPYEFASSDLPDLKQPYKGLVKCAGDKVLYSRPNRQETGWDLFLLSSKLIGLYKLPLELKSEVHQILDRTNKNLTTLIVSVFDGLLIVLLLFRNKLFKVNETRINKQIIIAFYWTEDNSLIVSEYESGARTRKVNLIQPTF